MGLDAWVQNSNGSELKYWRKFGELQNLMEFIWRREFPKESEGESFNCVKLELTPNILDEVISAIKTRTLPDHSGFFFGESNMGYPERLQEAEEFFSRLKEDSEYTTYYYNSWW